MHITTLPTQHWFGIQDRRMMPLARPWLAVIGCLLALSLALPVMADEDTTLSPYFQVNSDGAEVDQLPLLLTSVEVDIAGVIADVTVTQVYKNDGLHPLEAVYVFPASTRAAVYGMTMQIEDRTVFAQIKEKQQARQEYEEAKEAGKSASLLEQHRPNVFQMNVANILPGDRIAVKLQYTELLVPTDGVYEFVFPTVVGPRYAGSSTTGSSPAETWVSNPYLAEGEPPAALFDITVNLSTGIAIQEAGCGSHAVDIAYNGPNSARIELDDAEMIRTIRAMQPDYVRGVATVLKEFYVGDDFASLPAFYTKLYRLFTQSHDASQVILEERATGIFGGDRDYILKYRLAGDRIESGLLLYEGEGDQDENFFLFMMQPPARVAAQQIPAREYVFVVDVSGSMQGFPLDTSKRLLRNLIAALTPDDRFNVILFAGGSSMMADASVAATERNVQQALTFIEKQRGGGGTELLPALKRALNLPATPGMSRSIVVVTDGKISFESEAFELIRHNLNRANLFPFGIGSSVNRFLIEGMARVGLSEPFVVTNPAEAAAQAERFRAYIQSPVLTGITCEFEGFDAYDVEPVSVPDVLAARPVIVFGKWRGAPGGTVALSGATGQGEYWQSFDVANAAPSDTHRALRYLWARKRIESLGDYNALTETDARARDITELGLRYNLLTQYTSFVAIDREIRRVDDAIQTVKQPLPLPQGVSANAVSQTQSQSGSAIAVSQSQGSSVSSGSQSSYAVPEPGTLSLLGIGLLLAAWRILRNRRRTS